MGHLTLEDQLNLRDGGPVAPAAAAHHAACAGCRADIARLGALRDGLRSLPPLAPDPGAWARVVAAVAPPVTVVAQRSRIRLMVAAAAATAAFAVGVALIVPSSTTAPGQQVASAVRSEPSIADLKARSRRLEVVLDALAESPRVTSARSAGAIAELEDGIALVDYHLAQGGGTLDAAAERALWRRRIELMESLVTVRYSGERADSI
jgi:hypothetical protein